MRIQVLLIASLATLHADRRVGRLRGTRKRDPGARFPWKQLAGFGRWPALGAAAAPMDFDPWLALRLLGYPLDDRAATVRAFHRHFRGSESDTLDAEDARILHALMQPPSMARRCELIKRPLGYSKSCGT